MSVSNVHAVLTPPGAGGIAVLAAAGPDVLRVLGEVFRFGGPTSAKKTSSSEGGTSRFRSGRLHYGHVIDGGRLVDEVIVAVLDSSDAPTGCDYVEVNCHGGTVPVRAVSELLERRGVREIDPEQFMTLQVRPKRDRIQHEAMTLACQALTRLAAQHLFAQVAGALSGALGELLELDNSTEGIRARVEKLLTTASFGIGLHRPRTVTIVGRPNVGKSTLANMLVGSGRSLVHAEPGTTRDAVSSLMSLSGVPVRIVDTAGLRPALDEVEAAGVRVSRKKLLSADLVLWVFDHSRPLDGMESSHLKLLAGKCVISVVNKMDLPGGLPETALADTLDPELIHTCALSGRGSDELKRRVLTELFGPELPAVGTPIVFTEAVRELLLRLPEDNGAIDELAGFLSHRPKQPTNSPLPKG